jgi:hypothetical protein
MFDKCCNESFFKEQANVVRKAIDEDKWYLSERAGHDVGLRAAEEHFIENYLKGFAACYRILYCSRLCPDKQNCMLAQKYLIQMTTKY